MSFPGKVKKEKKNACILTGGQSKHCPPVKDLHLPLCEKHKRELNKLTRCHIADYIRSNFMDKDDESLIFNQKNGGVYSLNATGTFVFKEMLAGRTFCEILKKSDNDFSIDDLAEVITDYRLFIEELKKSSLIKADEV
ncbi:MAG: PqqD family protein [Smithellaceae bacterium]